MPMLPAREPDLLLETREALGPGVGSYVSPWLDSARYLAVQVAVRVNVGTPFPNLTIEEGIYVEGHSDPVQVRSHSIVGTASESYAEVDLVGRYVRLRTDRYPAGDGYVVDAVVRGIPR